MSAKTRTKSKAKGTAKAAVVKTKATTTKAATTKPEASAKTAKAKKTKATAGDAKPKRVSALDAAAQVLKSAGKPMRVQELIAAMAEQNLWKSPSGKTPAATLYAAVAREIAVKKDEARFRKTGPGQFAFNG